MTLPAFTIRQLFDSGVHFGHHPRRRNPKMDPYIYGVRNSVHIINLDKTVPLLQRALEALRDVAASGGRILFVGTKRQASEKITESGKKTGQYYVNHRWLGGMLTNWKTVSQSIRTLKVLEEQLNSEEVLQGLTKKELLSMTRHRDKLERALGGIKDMGGTPDILFVIDTNKEATAVAEARKLGIPVVGIVDTNTDPEVVTFPVPGNDDAIRAINYYCDLAVGAILSGLQTQILSAGITMERKGDETLDLQDEEILEAFQKDIVEAEGKETASTPSEDEKPGEAASE